MKDSSGLVSKSFLSALGVEVYILGVSVIVRNGERIFGQMKGLLGPVTFLMLFVVSAALTGALVLGRPVILYFDNKKTEGIKLFIYTIGWMFVLTLLGLFIQILK